MNVGEVGEDRRAQVGRWLSQRRDEMNLTVQALAAMLDVHRTTVTNAETGRVVPHLKSRWEDALRLSRGSLTRAYLDGTPLEALPDGQEPEPRVRAYTRTIRTPSGAEVSVTIAVAEHEKPAWFDQMPDDELLLMLRDDVRTSSD